MAYAVHIRRKSGRIELAEWMAFANAAPDLEPAGGLARGDREIPVYRWTDANLVWTEEGEIAVDGMVDQWRRKMGDIADRLDAEAIGDDGERYLADGRVDYGEGPESVQGIRTLAAFRYEPPTRPSRTPRLVAIAAIIVAIVAVAAFFALR